jgi:hypothetical protein
VSGRYAGFTHKGKDHLRRKSTKNRIKMVKGKIRKDPHGIFISFITLTFLAMPFALEFI